MCPDKCSPSFIDLGDHQASIDHTRIKLRAEQVVERIWDADHTVWAPDPTDINDRLGWLTLPDTMRPDLRGIDMFAAQIITEGFRYVVILGMGGSSLGGESLRRCFAVSSSVTIITLDSTIPKVVRAVLDAIDVSRTMFIVASKSGSTVEINWLFKYFLNLVRETVGPEKAGDRFVAVTDTGSSLDTTARKRSFRKVFYAPNDVGGRYSVLSPFGLVTAALSGIDTVSLLDAARSMEEACEPHHDADTNPGLWLGSVLGSLASNGRDKLTFIASYSLEAFSMWVEQLVAESTGKDGRGIIPITGEPIVDTSRYGDDRWFVFLKLDGDDCSEIDRLQFELKSTKHPVVEFTLNDRSELGAEFYRWEFAITIAAHIISVHPFNQPNVQQVKDLTNREISRFQRDGISPDIKPISSLTTLLGEAIQGDYLAILAFMPETKETNEAFAELRIEVLKRYGIGTTLGYGPRYLHSAGQLHKAGPDSGLFLQVIVEDDFDLKIPGENYSIKVLADAQVIGDAVALTAMNRRLARVVLESSENIYSLVEELKK